MSELQVAIAECLSLHAQAMDKLRTDRPELDPRIEPDLRDKLVRQRGKVIASLDDAEDLHRCHLESLNKGLKIILRRLMPPLAAKPPAPPLPVWDDESAIRALNGNRAHVDTLRELFAQELPKCLQAVTTAASQGDTSSIGAELHRLRASGGFVGAARLGAAVQALQHVPSSPLLLSALEHAAQDTLSQPSATQSPLSD